MSDIITKLQDISTKLKEKSETKQPIIDKIRSTAEQVGRAWSNSWLGYHSKVYYNNLEIPPAEAHFSVEWGLMDTFAVKGSIGDWRIFKTQDIIDKIYSDNGDPDLTDHIKISDGARELFTNSKTEIISLLTSSNFMDSDPFAENIYKKISELKLMKEQDYIKYIRPTSQIATRDTQAAEGGLVPPAHIQVEATLFAISSPFIVCGNLSEELQKCITHLKNKKTYSSKTDSIGENIFIGHGSSPLWRELKDFIHEKLKLPYEEFNRVSVAGIPNVTRLVQMLDNAQFAFLVMTAEDEQKDGTLQARMNVIHEAGLFQGRLGFEKAIILLEKDCEEFSNIHGLGQLRFPKGNISAIFENVREVLEREEIIASSN